MPIDTPDYAENRNVKFLHELHNGAFPANKTLAIYISKWYN